jgi:hypothetical protein
LLSNSWQHCGNTEDEQLQRRNQMDCGKSRIVYFLSRLQRPRS